MMTLLHMGLPHEVMLLSLLILAVSTQDMVTGLFCGVTSSQCMDNSVRLRCLTPGATIARITFASYGTPSTSGSCSSWSATPSCDAPGALAVATAACVGFPACAIPTFGVLFNNNTDPCPGKCKSLALAAVCTSGGGDAGGGASCAVNGSACPLPRWAPVYSIAGSTVCEPGGDMAKDYWVPAHPWGLVSLDWSVASSIWNKDGPAKGTAEATLTENCARIKAAHPGTKCFIYHNLELALQSFESQRAVMYDASKAHWFVQYTDGFGNKTGLVYNEPGGPGDQFFFDFRVPEAADYYIASVLALTANASVDGVFTDDVEGFPSEHDYAPLNTNISFADVAALQFASLETHGRLVAALAARGKFNWQAMGAGYEGESVQNAVPRDGCAEWMRARCGTPLGARAAMTAFTGNESLAAFLITRGPVAFIGQGWESGDAAWAPVFDVDVGEPVGACAEVEEGVFSRAWTYGNATLDCTAWAAVIPSKQ